MRQERRASVPIFDARAISTDVDTRTSGGHRRDSLPGCFDAGVIFLGIGVGRRRSAGENSATSNRQGARAGSVSAAIGRGAGPRADRSFI